MALKAIPTVDEAEWQGLIEALIEDRTATSRRIVERFHEEIPSYRRLSSGEITPAGVTVIEHVLTSIRDKRAPDPDEDLALYREHGHLRAQQGIPIEDMLRAWRIGMDEVRVRAEQHGASDSVRLEFIERMMAWLHVAMYASASAHREIELELARHDEHHRANLVRAGLFGSVAAGDLIAQVSAYGLDVGARYHAVRARLRPGFSIVDVERLLGLRVDGRPSGLAALVDGDGVGFAITPPQRASKAVIGVGPAVTLDSLAGSFQLATRALETALARGIDGVVHFEDLRLLPAVLSERDVGERLVDRYVAPVLRKGNSGQALLETIACYLRQDRRADATAAALHLHVNSLRYRLRRFEELTGADLKRTDDLFEIWWALSRVSMTAPGALQHPSQIPAAQPRLWPTTRD